MTAPSPAEHPVPAGTRVALHPGARLHGEGLLAGGAPWRLLRLTGASRGVVQRWRDGGVVLAGEERLARALVVAGLLDPVPAPVAGVEDVEVVIPVRDDAASLDRLLGELVALAVTVVDDGSREPAASARVAAAHGATWIGHESNRGPGAARNTGALATNRPLVWFVDVDVHLGDARDVLGRLRGALDDPLVGAAAPRVRGGSGAGARARFERAFSPLDRGARGGLVHPGGPVPFVPAACLLVRRSALGEGFATELRVGEDVDFVWRLVEDGWLVRYVAAVGVEHPARASWTQWWRQRVGYGRSTGELARRHRQAMAPVRVDRWTLVAWAGLLARAPWLTARSVAAVRASLARRLEGSTPEPARVARDLVTESLVRGVGPTARALTRTYGPLLWVAATHPRLRRRAVLVLAVGTAWRFRGTRARLGDVPLAVADDLAYGVGVASGAWRARSLANVTPALARSSLTWRDVLGLRRG